MTKKHPKYSSFVNYLPYIAFFIGSFLFFGIFADYVEYYQEKISLFVFSSDYLKTSLIQPGSLLVYFGRFLTTFYYYPVAGAIIISMTICLIMFMISRIISFLTGKPSILLPLLFGTAFFILQTNYQYLLYNSLGVLLQLVLFYLVIRYLKGYLPVVMLPFWYCITGGFAWIFALMYTLYLILKSIRKEWPGIISMFAFIFIVIYFLKEFFLFQPFKSLMIFPFSDENTGNQFLLSGSIICLIVFLPLIAKWKITITCPGSGKKNPLKLWSFRCYHCYLSSLLDYSALTGQIRNIFMLKNSSARGGLLKLPGIFRIILQQTGSLYTLIMLHFAKQEGLPTSFSIFPRAPMASHCS